MLIKGLTDDEVAQKIRDGKVNNKSVRSDRTFIQIILSNLFNPQNIILITSIVILLIVDNNRNNFIPGFLVVLNVALSLIQEIRAKIALDKLAALNISFVIVRRNGVDIKVDAREIVEGDIIKLTSGDPIIVDGSIVLSDYLEVDESILTGESEYIPKKVDDEILSGAFCVSGTGFMVAKKVGLESHLNILSRTSKAYKNILSPLQKSINVLLNILMIFMVLLVVTTIYRNTITSTPLATNVLNLVIIVSSVIPQGLIFAITIALAYGALRMTRYKVLVHKLNAIESMGQVDVLCADKTGTLTCNNLSVSELVILNSSYTEEIKKELSSFTLNISWMNRTIIAINSFLNLKNTHQVKKTYEVPFNSKIKWSGITFDNSKTYILGAPEVITNDNFILRKVESYTKLGFRVVIFAVSKTILNDEFKSLPDDTVPLALVIMEDKIRDNIKSTLDSFDKDNVSIKIISGDSSDTIKSIAISVGISSTNVINETDLQNLSGDDFKNIIEKNVLFARITPETKKKIIKSLRELGHHVAMIGDGVNDVPALKEASLAIAIDSGAQITKDISDMILLENAFSTLPKTFLEGINIKQKLFGILKIFLIKLTYLYILFFLAALGIIYFPLTILQATWLSFLIAGLPSTLIIFGFTMPKGNKDLLKGVIVYSIILGLIIGLFGLVIIFLSRFFNGASEGLERTLITVFASLYGMVILYDVHGVNLLSLHEYKKHWFVIILGIFLTLTILPFIYLLPLILDLTFLGVREWLVIVGSILLSYSLFRSIIYGLKAFNISNLD